jgi:hypothetical protein
VLLASDAATANASRAIGPNRRRRDARARAFSAVAAVRSCRRARAFRARCPAFSRFFDAADKTGEPHHDIVGAQWAPAHASPIERGQQVVALKQLRCAARNLSRSRHGSRRSRCRLETQMPPGLRRLLVACCIAIGTVLPTTSAAAQSTLPAARDLYAAAAYEDALQILNTIRGTAQPPEDGRAVEQYRAFCLLALGRTAEAESAIEALVQVAPSYRPADADMSPRVRTAFHEVRRRTLPAVIQRTYEKANAAFARKDPAAVDGFKLVLDLLADPDLGAAATQSPLAELRTLSTGFLALSTAPTPAPPPAPIPAPPPPPPTLVVAPPPPRVPTTNRIYGPEDVNVMPPIVVRQSFAPLADVFAVHAGIVEILIDEVGEVITAKTVVAVNAAYDRLALATARSWRYRPATLDGAAVKYRTIVQLPAKPR